MMRLEDFEDDFSKCAYNFRRIRLYDDTIIFADDYEIQNNKIILIYGYHKIAYLSVYAIKKVCDDSK